MGEIHLGKQQTQLHFGVVFAVSGSSKVDNVAADNDDKEEMCFFDVRILTRMRI
jgi:hypothetical protein